MPFLHTDLPNLIQAVGYAGLFGIIFTESGLLFGIIFPGDSLLFTAGLLASQGWFDIRILATLCSIAAILGDSTGYWLGAKFGQKIFSHEDSRWFRKEYIERTKTFYEQYGVRTIILARFIPIVRTVAPVLAGVGLMHYRTFLTYNIIGAILWGVGITWIGYTLGATIPNIETYIMPIVIGIIVISIAPVIFGFMKKDK